MTSDPFERRRAFHHLITQETRYRILQTIVAHPAHLPSLDELSFEIPRARSTIFEHLEILIDRDVVKTVERDGGGGRDTPKVFYGLTATGVDLLEEVGLFQAKETLQRRYNERDKPERIERYEQVPRPGSHPERTRR